MPCWGNTLKWRCTYTTFARAWWLELSALGKQKNPRASSPLPFPNPAYLVFNIHRGVSHLLPQPKVWTWAVKLSRTQTWLAQPLLAGPSPSLFAEASFQVQSLSMVPQWINLIKEEKSQLLTLKPLCSHATITPAAHAHSHNTKNHPEILLLQNLWTQTDVQGWKGKWSCRVPFLPWQKHTQVNYFLWPAPPSRNSEKKGKKKLS